MPFHGLFICHFIISTDMSFDLLMRHYLGLYVSVQLFTNNEIHQMRMSVAPTVCACAFFGRSFDVRHDRSQNVHAPKICKKCMSKIRCFCRQVVVIWRGFWDVMFYKFLGGKTCFQTKLQGRFSMIGNMSFGASENLKL